MNSDTNQEKSEESESNEIRVDISKTFVIHNSPNSELIDELKKKLDTKKDYQAGRIEFGKDGIITIPDLKETLSIQADSVFEQNITNEVKAALAEAIDEVTTEELFPQHDENTNQQIVVHVGGIEDIHRFGITIPKVPDYADFLVPAVKVEEKPEDVIDEVAPEKLFEEQPDVVKLPSWMLQPPSQANCPYGLEFLSVIDTVQINQTKIMPGNSRPSFMVSNHTGQYIYEVDVRSNCISNFFCASRRKYEMSILNGDHVEVMHFSRPSEIHGRRSMEVFAPFDTLIGKVTEGRGPLPYFVIMDSTNEVLFRVEAIAGPPDCKTYTFGIMPTDGDNLIGKIKQETCGTLKKILRENCITINFYINLDAKIKALVLGASFLIDLIFFEMF